MIDAVDLPLVEGRSWQAMITDRGGVYAMRIHRTGPGKRHPVLMHRQIMGEPEGAKVDHRDRDGLNNRRLNLRVATSSQNSCNTPARRDCKSGIKGVFFSENRWVASLNVGGVSVLKKRFKTKEAAAEAVRIARELHHGEFASHG